MAHRAPYSRLIWDKAAGPDRAMIATANSRGTGMSLGTILLIVLILILIGVIPTWPHSRGWGYAPSGILGVLLVIVIVLLLLGRL